MADLDVKFAGGATGSMTRAAQIQAQAVINAQNRARALLKPPTPVPGRSFRDPDVRENRNPAVTQPPLPVDQQWRSVGPLIGSLTGKAPGFQLNTPYAVSPKTGLPTVALPVEPDASPLTQGVAASQRDPKERQRFLDMTPEQRDQARKNVKEAKSRETTIAKMVEDVRKDPIQDSNRIAAADDLADLFKQDSRSKYFTNDDLSDNPTLKLLNDLSVWSTYRLKVSDWRAGKQKSGGLSALPSTDSGGDGTFTGIVENGSFSSVTSPSSLPPYLVVRDEHGMLTIVNADQWIQARYTEMHKNPGYAAQMVTALALTGYYGSDSTANAQASRVAVDRNGNPVKAIANPEDASALKKLANDAAMWQGNGEEVAIDDMLGEVVKLGVEVSRQNGANGEHGGGGGGGFGRGGGGFGGGSRASVRLTDSTQLSSIADSISRQRMGRSLTPEEQAAFVAHFHELEVQSNAAFSSGQAYTPPDPEGQAVAWVTGHFQQEASANQYGQLASQLIAMMGTTNPFAGIV